MRFSNALLIGLSVLSFTFCKKKEDVAPDAASAQTERTVGVQSVTYNHVITTSQTVVDASKLNLPAGAIIGIEAGTRGPLLLKNFVGAEGKPLVIVNKGGKVKFTSSGSYGMKVEDSKYIRLTGTGDPDIKYGLEIDGGHIGISMDNRSTNFQLDHMEIHGCGFAGVMAKTDPSCDKSTWRENFTMRDVILNDNYVHDVKGEGFYVGNSFYLKGRSLSCGTIMPHSIENVKLYNNITRRTGCEGIQVGCVLTGCEIYDNVVEDFGNDPFANFQNNGIQIGEGTGGKLYNNIVKNGPGNGIVMLGLGDNVVYNNVVINSGAIGIFVDERYTPGPGFTFLNNTIINPGDDGIRFYSELVSMNTFKNNIIVKPGSGKFVTTKSGVKLTESNNLFTNNISEVKFASVSNDNFTLLSGSPAIDKGTSAASFGVINDYNKVSRPQGVGFDIGAYEFGGSSTTPPVTETPTPDPIPTIPPTTAKVTLTLIDANSGKDLGTLANGYKINLATIGTNAFNVRANTGSGIGSIVFNLDGKNVRTEAYAPITLFGDGGGKYNPGTFSEGNHTLKAIAYSGANGDGSKVGETTVSFSVENSKNTTPIPTPTTGITSLTLVNANNSTDIGTLTNGYQINLATIGTNAFNVRANTSSGVGSIVFNLDGKNVRTEAYAPITLFGDGNGKYNPGSFSVGNHTLIATAYSAANGGGSKIGELKVTFTVTNGTSTPAPLPVPLPEAKFVVSEDAYLQDGRLNNSSEFRVENNRRITYLKVTVSGRGTTAATKAVLRVKCGSDKGHGPMRVYKGSHSNWTSSNLAIAKPSKLAQVGTINTSYTPGRIYEIDVTKAITGDGTYTFIIEKDAGGNDASFKSIEGGYSTELIVK